MAVRAFSAVATIIRDRLRHTSAVARLLKVERCASQQSTIISYKLDSSAVQLYTTAAAPDSTLYVCAHSVGRPPRARPRPPLGFANRRTETSTLRTKKRPGAWPVSISHGSIRKSMIKSLALRREWQIPTSCRELDRVASERTSIGRAVRREKFREF